MKNTVTNEMVSKLYTVRSFEWCKLRKHGCNMLVYAKILALYMYKYELHKLPMLLLRFTVVQIILHRLEGSLKRSMHSASCKVWKTTGGVNTANAFVCSACVQ